MARRTTAKSAGPQRILALGSAALFAFGLIQLLHGVATLTQRATGWLPLVCGALGLCASAIWPVLETPVEEGVLIEEPPEPQHRLWIAIAVLAVLALLALVPLRYYFGDDRYDERFSWRMFSAVRMHDCQLRVTETIGGSEQVVDPQRWIHVGWITTLERNREAVVERYLRWRCTHEGVEAARIENQCSTPDGATVPLIARSINCASGEIEKQGGTP